MKDRGVVDRVASIVVLAWGVSALGCASGISPGLDDDENLTRVPTRDQQPTASEFQPPPLSDYELPPLGEWQPSPGDDYQPPQLVDLTPPSGGGEVPPLDDYQPPTGEAPLSPDDAVPPSDDHPPSSDPAPWDDCDCPIPPEEDPPALCRVTGGGRVLADGSPDSFGGNAQPFGTDVDGEWNHVTHDGDHFHGDPASIDCFDVEDSPTTVPIRSANAILFSGTGTWNDEDGCDFTVYIEDHGEPGRADVYQIDISCPSGARYSAGDTLYKGNLQIHSISPGHLP